MILNTLGFDANYEVIEDTAAAAVSFTFDREQRAADDGGLVLRTSTSTVSLRVKPFSSPAWAGRFQEGAEGLTGVFATPSADVICVVARGNGYWAPVLEPTQFEMIASVPIREVLPVSARQLLLFVDYTTIAAYGPSGRVWVTRDLSWDGLNIDNITGDTIFGSGWDSPSECRVPFTVDLIAGTAHGGSSPALYGISS
jgi:hypothetical protein